MLIIVPGFIALGKGEKTSWFPLRIQTLRVIHDTQLLFSLFFPGQTENFQNGFEVDALTLDRLPLAFYNGLYAYGGWLVHRHMRTRPSSFVMLQLQSELCAFVFSLRFYLNCVTEEVINPNRYFTFKHNFSVVHRLFWEDGRFTLWSIKWLPSTRTVRPRGFNALVLHSLVCPSESVFVSVVKHPSCVLCVNGVSSETSHWPSPAPWWLWRSCTCSPTWPTTPWWRPPSSCCLTPWPWSVIGNQTAKSGPKRPTVVCCCRAFVCSCVSADVCPPRHPGDCSCDPGPRGPVVPRRSQRGLVRLTKVIWRQRHGCCPLCVCVWAENLVLSPALSLCCRMMLVGSREGQWPLIFSMIHIRRQTPLPAVMFQVKWFQYTEHRSRLPCLSKPRFFKLLPLVVVVVLFWHSVLSVFSTPCRFW